MTEKEPIDSFNKIHWHDSKFRSFAIKRERGVDNVIFDLELRETSGNELTQTTLILEDAAYLRVELDLDGKAQCSDDISSALCERESALKKELLRSQLKYNPTALDDY